jgi:hypothetical protein
MDYVLWRTPAGDVRQATAPPVEPPPHVQQQHTPLSVSVTASNGAARPATVTLGNRCVRGLGGGRA